MSMTEMTTTSKSASAASAADSNMPPPAPPKTTAAGGSRHQQQYSGLSALILAATSQFGHLIDNDTASTSEEGSHLSPGLDSEGDMRMDSPPPLSSHHMPPNFDSRTSQTVVSHGQSRTHPNQNHGRPLAFPEQLMKLLMDTENNRDIATFLPDGKYFALRRKEFSERYLYVTFHLTTYEEFLELMRGWGFVRVNTNHAAEEEEEEASKTAGSPMSSGSTSAKADAVAAAPNSKSVASAVQASSKAAIQVFKYPQHQHFKKGNQVDMEKIRFHLGKGHKSSSQQNHDAASAAASQLLKAGASPEMTAAVPTRAVMQITSSMSDDSAMSNLDGSVASNTKRRLSPSHANRDSEDTLQKQRMVSDHLHHQLPVSSVTGEGGGSSAPSLPRETFDQPVQSARMARRRSSLELRSMASEITTSQLNVLSNEQGEDAEDDGPIANGATTVKKVTPSAQPSSQSQNRPSVPSNVQNGERRKSERRNSSASLVDGAVEAATHTIVTDAIETLLFDEVHTRQTYKKHEKELSVSSLPGVVPISKQLFSRRSPAGSTSGDTPGSETTVDGTTGNGTEPRINGGKTTNSDSVSRTRETSIPGMPSSLSAACLVNSEARSSESSDSDPPPQVSADQQEALKRLATARASKLASAAQNQQHQQQK
mmetsp:Transcript_52437/g.126951  ORF Transcript_52437/g.126951 Transcript_52437/m.126951 type:complete len:653 (+) Transcript_52437:351-2309(+)